MIKKLIVATSNTFNPYQNLAFEEYLFNTLEKDAFVLYLWRNDNTVVIGKNQNAYLECNVSMIAREGAYVARRKTGGGAVFHDKKNLNFTFIAYNSDYDVKRQLNLIINALETFGIKAEFSGRNDILVDGRKFSGNAFLSRDNKSMHHGTILIDVNIDKIMRYLTVQDIKLSANSVKSVKSRVVNLSTINSDICVENLIESIINTTISEYSSNISYISINDCLDNFTNLIAEYSDKNFILGNKRKFSMSVRGRFDWGTVNVDYDIVAGLIDKIDVYTDSLDPSIKEKIEKALLGTTLADNIIGDIEIINVAEMIKNGG